MAMKPENPVLPSPSDAASIAPDTLNASGSASTSAGASRKIKFIGEDDDSDHDNDNDHSSYGKTSPFSSSANLLPSSSPRATTSKSTKKKVKQLADDWENAPMSSVASAGTARVRLSLDTEAPPPPSDYNPHNPFHRPSLAAAASPSMPTLPKGQIPSWSDLRIKHRLKFNTAGAQVALVILMAASFILIKPIGEIWASNPVYVAMSAIVVAEPKQTASVRLFAQRFLGILLSGAFSIFVLYLDSILPPQGCLHCSWKPYVSALITFIFFYVIVTVRETVPAQAYTSKMVDLTFLITFLSAYDDQRNGIPWDNYTPALTRLGSVALGIMLTMIGAFLFWPVRVNVVHRRITGDLFKDFAGFIYDVLHEGYLTPVKRKPESVAIQIEDVDPSDSSDDDSDTATPQTARSSFEPHSLENQFDNTDVTVAVGGGMDVLDSQEAVTAETVRRPRKKKRWHPNIFKKAKKNKKVWFRNLPGSAQESDEEEDDGVITATRFRAKIHPAAVKILRTLEKERARLEASYKVELRMNQSPHFVPTAPLDKVIRRLRLLFYQVVSLYSERLVELRGVRAESRQTMETTSNPFWHTAWVDDTTSLSHSFPSTTAVTHPTSHPYQQPYQSPFSPSTATTITDDEIFDLAKYISSICVTLMDLGDVTLATTSRARAVPVGAAELCARLEVVAREVGRAREGLEGELVRVRGLINARFDGLGTGIMSPISSRRGSTVVGGVLSGMGIGSGNGVGGVKGLGDVRAFGSGGSGGMAVEIGGREKSVEDGLKGSVVALRYALLIRVWEMSESVVGAVYDVERLVRAYNRDR
ncbi:hypothetical protein HDV00_004512 [Rhizophlyctis rosea]|nr:hypothetical protein HDV00_004512 [Rhizophlyctis rosea]